MSRGPGLSLGERVKTDFDVLKREVNGHPLVYLDSAATSQKPNEMLNAMHSFYHKYNSNIHKGVEHNLSKVATQHYEDARKKVAKFINARRPEEVVFTRNATEGLNIVAQSWGGKHLKPGDEIIMSVAEHHSNLAPWQLVAGRTGAVIKECRLTPDTQELDLEHLESLLSKRTRVVSLVHVSNMLGFVTNMPEVVRLARKVGALVLSDSCQAVPHMPVDVQQLGCDWLVASGHKMCGPTASGFLWGRHELLEEMPPFMVGGETTGEIHLEDFQPAPPPLKFEAGTPAIAEAIGFGAAIDYLSRIGMEEVHKYASELARRMYLDLSSLPGIRIFGPPPTVPQGRAAVVSFQIEGIDMPKLAQELDKQGIAVSAGFHRTKPLHEHLGLGPTMRASCYIYTTPGEVDLFLTRLREAIPRAKPVQDKVQESAQHIVGAVKSAMEP